MLKDYLSISGKSGLYKLISQGKNLIVAESLADGKRIPVYPRDKVISLGDITIYTNNEEVKLAKVLTNILSLENNNPVAYNPAIQPDELRTYFEKVLPDFDKDKVYPSDIKKILSWYNLLISKGITEFETATDSEEKKEEEEKEPDKPVTNE
ncbi:MAG: DUF5606 domain-containing protein [Dysgonamonadaceae bacterium]|jgi:hypothetical protein|nr:DUF5606 domain-containing protein [Dysgonamonadaceae bacterium]